MTDLPPAIVSRCLYITKYGSRKIASSPGSIVARIARNSPPRDAAGDEHVADVAADLRRQVRAQPLAERGDALRLRVAVVARADRLDGGGLGDLRDVEVGQPDREVDRVLHLRGEVEDLADAGGIDAEGAAGDEVGGGAHGSGQVQNVKT